MNIVPGSGLWIEPYVYDSAEEYMGSYIMKDRDSTAVTYDYSNADDNYFEQEYYIQNIAESAQSTADVSAGIMDSVNQVSGVIADVSGMSEKQNSIAQNLTDVVSRFRL